MNFSSTIKKIVMAAAFYAGTKTEAMSLDTNNFSTLIIVASLLNPQLVQATRTPYTPSPQKNNKRKYPKKGAQQKPFQTFDTMGKKTPIRQPGKKGPQARYVACSRQSSK